MSTVLSEKPLNAAASRAVVRPPRKPPAQLNTLMRLMARETGRAILFEIAAKPDSKVTVAGTFNNWDPTSHPLAYHPEDGVFRATLHLPAGTHQYKFMVDGVWHLDIRCPHWTPNEHGSLNSVIHI